MTAIVDRRRGQLSSSYPGIYPYEILPGRRSPGYYPPIGTCNRYSVAESHRHTCTVTLATRPGQRSTCCHDPGVRGQPVVMTLVS